ncbi:unnamed protein product [Amoebophrya sp. A120]|nr:unnamed protein product [Amoebophrya sp. A120]|eukprot:GSA120T00023448001.1
MPTAASSSSTKFLLSTTSGVQSSSAKNMPAAGKMNKTSSSKAAPPAGNKNIKTKSSKKPMLSVKEMREMKKKKMVVRKTTAAAAMKKKPAASGATAWYCGRRNKNTQTKQGEAKSNKSSKGKTKTHAKKEATEEEEDEEDDSSEDDTDSDEDPRLKWPALESNPEAFTSFMHRVGVAKQWQFHDVFDLDMLDQIPDVTALVLLYPIVDEEGEALMPTANRKRVKLSDDAPFFIWQGEDLGNACGTISIIHAVANCEQVAKTVKKKSALSEFLAKCKKMTPEERGSLLDQDEAIMEHVAEVACDAELNQTDWYKLVEDEDEDPEVDLDTDHHFITFIEKNNVIYELDGLRNMPLKVGTTSSSCSTTSSSSSSARSTTTSAKNKSNFLPEVAKIIKTKFLNRAPENMQFATLALGGKEKS